MLNPGDPPPKSKGGREGSPLLCASPSLTFPPGSVIPVVHGGVVDSSHLEMERDGCEGKDRDSQHDYEELVRIWKLKMPMMGSQ